MAGTVTATNPVAAGVQPATLQTPVPLKNFAFLNHFWRPGPAAVEAPLQPQFANPGFLTHSGVQVSRKTSSAKGLQDLVDDMLTAHQRLKNKPKIEDLRFALVDLTEGKLFQPDFAGHRATTQGGLGSTAKLGVMMGAFQLHFDLNAFAKKNPGLADEAALFSAIRAEWGKSQVLSATPVVTPLHPGDSKVPKMELQDRLVKIEPTFQTGLKFPLPLNPQVNAPRLEKMFTAAQGPSGFLAVRFQGSLSMTEAAQTFCRDTPENLKEVRKLSFAERLAIMIDDSDDAASQTCVEDVGYIYMASALWQSDLFSPARDGGLWIGSAFLNKKLRWIETPVPDHTQPKGDSFTACTAATIAAMLTLVQQNRMISQDVSEQMRRLLSKRKAGLRRRFRGKLQRVDSFSRSFLEESLSFHDPGTFKKPRFQLDEVFSKLGIGNRFGDAAIVRRTDRGKKLHYVAVGLDDTSIDKLHELIVQLDMVIQKNNGLAPLDKPAP